MTKEIIDYLTRDLMKQGKILKHSQGLSALHTDFINNDESQGYRVTFVNGLDDPDNDPVLVAEREAEKTKQDRLKELKDKKSSRTKAETDELLDMLAERL